MKSHNVAIRMNNKEKTYVQTIHLADILKRAKLSDAGETAAERVARDVNQTLSALGCNAFAEAVLVEE